MDLLELTCYGNDPATLTLIDGTNVPSSEWRVAGDVDWGNADWDVAYSGQRGSQGAKATSSTPRNRTVTIPLAANGTDKDTLAAQMSDLAGIVDAVRRWGGRLTVKHQDQSWRQHLEVVADTVQVQPAGRRFQERSRADLVLTLTCEPYVVGDPMGWVERFDTDVLTDGLYEYELGSGALSVDTGNRLLIGTAGTETRIRNAVPGYSYGDLELRIRWGTGSSGSNVKAGVFVKRLAADTRLEVYADDNGTNGRLRVDKVVGGTRTNLASTNFTSSTRAHSYSANSLTVRIEGPKITATNVAGVTTTLTHTLSTSDQATFGLDDYGPFGLVFTPVSGAWIGSLQVMPFSYGSASLPDELVLRGTIPGDAPAPAEVRLQPSSSAARDWAGLAWWEAPPGPRNLLLNGNFSLINGSTVFYWSNGVTSITSAGSGFGRVLLAGQYGRAAGYVDTTATAQGIGNAMHHRFRAGVTYTARAYLKVASGTITAARLRLGVAADLASSSAATISTSGYTLVTVSWTPTADVDLAYLALDVTAGTGRCYIDAVEVYEDALGRPTMPSQRDGDWGLPPVGVIVPGRAMAPYTGLSNFTLTSGLSTTTYRNGYALRSSAASQATAVFPLDPLLVQPDDHSDSVDVEVWARIVTPTTYTAATRLQAFLTGDGGTYSYTMEYGSAGRLLTFPVTTPVLALLGTLSVPVDATARTNLRLGVQFDTNGGGAWTGNFDLAYLVLLPARGCATYPTGDTDYEAAADRLGYGTSIRIASDLRAIGGTDPNYANPEPTYSGVGGPAGSMIEVPAGDLTRFLAMVTEGIPDTAEAGALVTGIPAAQQTCDVQVTPTPRWAYMRDQ